MNDAVHTPASKPKADSRIAAPRLNVVRFELDCGAVLLVDQRPGASVTAIKLHLKGGHSLDPAGLEGLASLTGSLLDQGTKSRTEEQIAEVLEPKGGGIRGDANGLSGSIAGDAWKQLAGLIAEAVCEPSFPKDKFARQKERLLDRLLIERDDHRTQAGRLFRRMVYGKHWMGRAVYGSLESVVRITRKDVVAFHAKNWCPTRAAIAVCGDVDPETVRRFFNRRFKAWTSKRKLERADIRFPERASRCEAFYAKRQQVHVYLGHLGITRDNPHYSALVVMDHILGTGPGFSNRISRKLRDEQGLAYTVHADVHSSAGVFPGMFTAYIGTSPEHIERATHGFLEEMKRIRDDLVEEHELELAVNYLLGSYALGYERASRRTNFMISAERFGLPPNYLESLPDKFAAVTAHDVREAARACLFPDKPCFAVAGPVRKRDVEAIFAKLLGKQGSKRNRTTKARD